MENEILFGKHLKNKLNSEKNLLLKKMLEKRKEFIKLTKQITIDKGNNFKEIKLDFSNKENFENYKKLQKELEELKKIINVIDDNNIDLERKKELEKDVFEKEKEDFINNNIDEKILIEMTFKKGK